MEPRRTGADGKERGRTERWCPGAESNHRHLHFQCSALPTELPGRRTRRAAGGRSAARYKGSVSGCPDEPARRDDGARSARLMGTPEKGRSRSGPSRGPQIFFNYISDMLLTTYRAYATYRISSLMRGVSGDDPAGGAGCGVPGRARNRDPGGSGRPGPKSPGWNAGRPVPVCPGRPRLANVVRAFTRARRMRIPPPGAPPAPRLGAGDARRGRKNPGAETRAGNEEHCAV